MLTADTITDEMIRELWRWPSNAITGRLLLTALGESDGLAEAPTAEEIRAARARCAELLNARAKESR